MKSSLRALLTKLGACSESIAWCKENKIKTLSEAWQKCPRGDWMLWYAGRVSGPVGSDSRKKVVLAAAECAALVLPIYEKRYPNDGRVRKCIEACRGYAAGTVTMDQLREARYASAYAAASVAAVAYAASDAASDAAYASASDAAYASAYAAASVAAVAYAASASASASASDAAYAERKAMLQKCADIVRSIYLEAPSHE